MSLFDMFRPDPFKRERNRNKNEEDKDTSKESSISLYQTLLLDEVIYNFSKIDFTKIIDVLKGMEVENPSLKLLIHTLERLIEIGEKLNAPHEGFSSEILYKELVVLSKEYDLNDVITILEPIAGNLPFGRILLFSMKQMVKHLTV